MTLAAIGLGTTAYAAHRRESPLLWTTLGYFSLMELLQAFTYLVIGQCGSPANQIMTLLGYLHIAFQPVFGVAFSSYFIPEPVRRRVLPWGVALGFASAVFMLIQLYPFAWAGLCHPVRAMCSDHLCSVFGTWHIAWHVPYNGLTNGLHPFLVFPSYLIAMFLFPLLMGSWKMTLYHIIMGPTLAFLLTRNFNEWPAVWCLLSIGFLLLVVKTPLRRYMFVNNWPLWPKSWLIRMKTAR